MNSEELNGWIRYINYPPSSDPVDEFLQQLFEENPRPDFEHERRITLFESYLHTLEGYLEQEVQQVKDEADKIRTEINKKFEELNEDVKAGRISSDPEVIARHQEQILACWVDPSIYEQYRLETIDEFADTLRKSFFINLCGFWESQLFPLCKSLKSYDEKMPPPKNTLAYPSRAEKFFDRINFPLGDGTTSHTVHNCYWLLRNCLVHNNGEPERWTNSPRDRIKRDGIKNFIRSEQPLLTLKGQMVVINKGFCEKSLETINSYFDELLTALGNWALSQTAS